MSENATHDTGFQLSEEQRQLAEALNDLLDAESASAAVRRCAFEGGGFDATLWRHLAEWGACGLHLPEAQGGLGLGPTELTLVAEALGAHLACVPWLESAVLAGTLLAASESTLASAWLPDIASGQRIATVDIGLLPAPSRLPVQATATAQGWRLSGLVPAVPAGTAAQCLLLWCAVGGPEGADTLLLAVELHSPGIQRRALRQHDATRPVAEIRLQDVAVPSSHLLARGEQAKQLKQTAERMGTLALSAELTSVAQRCLDLTLAYLAQRVQFGRPLAQFQALKHRCAQMMVHTELARSAVRGAALRLDATSAAMARCLADEAAQFCTQEALQLHGGVGYTWEYDPQLYFKRAQAARSWLGTPQQWRERVATRLWDAAPRPSVAETAADEPHAGFRAEIATWLRDNLCGEFEPLRGHHGVGDGGYDRALGKHWEQRLAAGGWVGIGWPRQHGGRALPLAQQVVFHEEYVRAGGPGRIGHIGETLLAPTLMAYGTLEQQQRFLPGIRAGTEYWAQGYSEPNAGSDLANVQTRARRVGDAWVIDGQKVWTSWAEESDWIFVLARCEPGSLRHHGLVLLLVPLRQPGISIRPIRQMTGGAEFNEVFFDGARTEASLHLGEPGQGWAVAMALLGFERGVSTLGQQAQFEAELQALLSVARRNGAAQDAVMRQRIAQAALGLQALRCNALRVLGVDAEASSASAASGRPASPSSPTSGVPPQPREAFIAKYAWSNWRRDFGRLAADVLGAAADLIDADVGAQSDADVDAGDVGAGQRRAEHAILRSVWLSSRADTIYAGANEIQLNLIAERALGMPR